MLSVQTYYAILLAVCAYAFLAGRSDERIVAGICAIASVASAIVVAPLGSRYSNVEAGIFLVDVAQRDSREPRRHVPRQAAHRNAAR